MKKVFFNPGPSELYFTVEGHIRQAMKENIGSISHRSKDFETIFSNAEEKLRELLKLPTNYKIVFTASATEIWERLIQNINPSKSLHLTNGAFSKKFYKAAIDLGIDAHELNAPEGNIPIIENAPNEDYDLISVTNNATSTGVFFDNEQIKKVRDKYPNAIISVDAVSSLPYAQLDYDIVDSVYFSVQKCFGLPAGLGVWLVNERCIERANELKAKGKSIGSYHSLPSLLAAAAKNQTPETPNILGIYLFSKVLNDMCAKGIKQIRQEINYKAAVLYHALENHDKISPFVTDSSIRSNTVIVAQTNEHTINLKLYLEKHNLLAGSGYGSFKNEHLRFANFPTHSKEQYEMLSDLIVKW